MTEIEKTEVEQVETGVKKPAKRSTLYNVLASLLLVVLLGLFAGLAYWGYQSYFAVETISNEAGQSAAPSVIKTAEEKALDQAALDLKADETISTESAEKDAQDIDNIDISGL